jgi:transcriptional regulator with XRE-family HTH domain
MTIKEIKRYLKRFDINRKQLADHCGLHPSQVNRMLSGEIKNPKPDKVELMAKSLIEMVKEKAEKYKQVKLEK